MQDGRDFTIYAQEESKGRFKITKATDDEVIDMIKDIRPLDKQEIEKLTGLPFNMAVLDILITYQYPIRKLTYGDEVLGFGGWDDTGIVWLVLTTEYNKHKVSFLRWGKKYLKVLLKRFDTVYNVIWSKNVDHIKFLKFFGATFEDIGNDLLLFKIKRGD